MWSGAFGYGKRTLPEMESGDFVGGGLMSSLHKRSRTHFSNQWSHGSNVQSLIPPNSYHKPQVHEESPLGLHLKKSPSLLDLIQMRLSQDNTPNSSFCASKSEHLNHKSGKKIKEEKLKASNFTASRLRIGSWEFITKNAGCGLIAKFYYAKQKLVWEVLESGLKYKMEIEWSDITALKANYPDNQPGILAVVLGKQPLFYKESDPQPKKHTLWHATGDFTGGQASTYKLHFLEFPHGVLDRHYEKLIKCDTRLRLLSQLPQTHLDSPYFVIETSNPVEVEPKDHVDNQLGEASESPITGFATPLSVPQPTSSQVEQPRGCLTIGHEDLPKDAHPPMPGAHAMNVNPNHEVHNIQNLNMPEQLDAPFLLPSIVDLVDEENHFIPNQPTSGEPHIQEKGSDIEFDLDELHRLLFSESTTSLDESFLMSKVNSFGNLIELDKDPETSALNSLADLDTVQAEKVVEPSPTCDLLTENKGQGIEAAQEMGPCDFNGNKQLPGMSRNDSFVELLDNLPRIGSLPQLC